MTEIQAGSKGKAETATRDKNVSGAADSGESRVGGTRAISKARLEQMFKGYKTGGNVKKILGLLIFVLMSAAQAMAGPGLTATAVPSPTGHTVVTSWTAPVDAGSGSTYDVFAIHGAACPISGTAGFVKITAAPVSVLTFTDAAPSVGQNCYYVVQNQGGATSVPSNLAPAVILPLPPVLQPPVAN